MGAGAQFADGGYGVDFPHGGLRPQTVKGEGKLAVVLGEFVVGEVKVAFEPFEEGRFEDAAVSIEGVAGEPDEFGFVETELSGVLELFAKFIDVDDVAETHFAGAIDERESC